MVGAVKVAGVRTANDDGVALLFARSGVLVIGRSARQNRLLRCAGGTVFAASALGAAAIGVGHVVNIGLGLWLSAAAVVLVAVSTVLVAVAWIVAVRQRRQFRSGTLEPTISVEAVKWARSAGRQGRITVSLGLTNDAVHEFTATGLASVQLAQEFAAMLRVTPASEADIVAVQ